MINNLLQKVLFSTAVGTVIGLSSILGTISSAAALTINSPSVNQRGQIQDISNIVLYLKDNSGTITKVKIDSVSGTKSYDATNFLNKYYSSYEVVAYTVKSANNKSEGMGSGEGELFDSNGNKLNADSNKEYLNKDGDKADITYQYSTVSQIQPSPQAPAPAPVVQEPAPTPVVQAPAPTPVVQAPAPAPVVQEPAPTPVIQEPAPTPVVQEPDIQPIKNTYVIAQEPSPKKVKVPEPGSIAAIAIFGIGGLLAKKKVSS